MEKLLIASLLTSALALPGLAAQAAGDHDAGVSSALTEMTQGEVRKVDNEASKLTIKHGEIKKLDMPPMTMVFQVNDRPGQAGHHDGLQEGHGARAAMVEQQR